MDFSSLQETISNQTDCTCGESLFCICIINMDFGIPVISTTVATESTISTDITETQSEKQDDEKQYLDDLVCNLTGNESYEECTQRFLEYIKITHRIDQKRYHYRKHQEDLFKKGLVPLNSTILASKKRKSRRDFHWMIKRTKAYKSKKSTGRTRKHRESKK